MKSFFLVGFLLLSSCATYQNNVAPARKFLEEKNCEKALEQLEPLASKDSGDQLVYLMDYGTALQICGEYKKSIDVFLKAEKLSEQNDYHSASRITGATLLNEEMIQYKGDTFEKLFLNVSLALNFIQLGQYDSALIEVRKMNQKFAALNADNKKPYELNSFSKYLSGLIWELDKKYDDACIDYKDSYFLDTRYRQVGLDMLRACYRANRNDEFKTLSQKISATEDELKFIKNKKSPEIIYVFLQGWGPKKVPRDSISARLQPVYSRTQKIEVSVDQERFISTPIYSVTEAAVKTLESDHAALIARRVGARVTKEVVADQIRQKDSALGAAAWLIMVASERADLRQWSTLPETIHVLRVPVTAGEHDIKVVGLDSSGTAVEMLSETKEKIQPREQFIRYLRSVK